MLALAIAAIAGGPLIWDGSSDLFHLLDKRSPASSERRLINYPLQLPALMASHFTDNFVLLRLIYSACYVSVPAIGLAASWLISREKRPSLFVWPALSWLAMMPLQFGFCGESLMAATLAWPILLTTLTDPRPILLLLVAPLCLAEYGTHPIAVLLLGFAALVGVVRSLVAERLNKMGLAIALGVGIVAIAKVLHPLYPYERDLLTFAVMGRSFRKAVLGWPLVALGFELVGAAALLRSARTHRDLTGISRAGYLAVGAIVAGGLRLVPWALVAHRWAHALDYRFWVAPITLLFMSAAAAEVLWLRPNSFSDLLWRERTPAVLAVGVVSLAVLSIQSVVWVHLTGRLASAVEESKAGCISRSDLGWARDTPLDHWATDYYAIDLQGRRPRTLVLESGACEQLAATASLRLGPHFLRPPHRGWFDLDQIRITPAPSVRREGLPR